MTTQAMKKYFIFQEGDDILLVVNAAPDDFDDETIKEILDEARARGFEDAVDCNIKDRIDMVGRGEVVRIGGINQEDGESGADRGGALLTQDTDAPPARPFEIEIQKDKLSAKAIAMDDTAMITEEQLRGYMGEIGIVYGVIDENVAALIKNFPQISEIKIARGTPVTQGRDAKIELVKDIKTDLTPETRNGGRADFKKLNLISPVRAGDVIQIRTPPTKAEPGKDIFGKEIPGSNGSDKLLKAGVNTKVSKDGCSLIATDEGFLYLGYGGTINVRAVYQIEGDVDYHTGIVEYKGDIIIKGDVRSGFNVHAGGDIHIRGSVEDAVIEAGGDLQIDGGVRSSGDALIKAGGHINVSFIENARVEAPGNIHINREAINCRIKAGGDIEVKWDKGRIIGGYLEAGGWIAAPTLGSELGSPIELALEPPGWERHFKVLDRINDNITNVVKDENISDDERAGNLKKLVEERVFESDTLDDVFAYSFATAKSYQSPVNVRCGNVVHKVVTDIGTATFIFKGLEIRREKRFVDKMAREELLKKRKAEEP